MTPSIDARAAPFKPPVFDASKEGFRIQDSVVRMISPGFETKASKTGSSIGRRAAENEGVKKGLLPSSANGRRSRADAGCFFDPEVTADETPAACHLGRDGMRG